MLFRSTIGYAFSVYTDEGERKIFIDAMLSLQKRDRVTGQADLIGLILKRVGWGGSIRSQIEDGLKANQGIDENTRQDIMHFLDKIEVKE